MTKLRNNTAYTDHHSFVFAKGDIFSASLEMINFKNGSSTIIIPHVCNNVGLFGGGFSGAIDSRFPEVAINFSVGGKLKLGNTQFITVAENTQSKSKLVIANMVAQNGVISPKNRRPLHYPSLVRCMYSVKDFAESLKKTEENIRIHAPKFGSGLAGGNWYFISDLIDDIWSMFDVSIYTK